MFNSKPMKHKSNIPLPCRPNLFSEMFDIHPFAMRGRFAVHGIIFSRYIMMIFRYFASVIFGKRFWRRRRVSGDFVSSYDCFHCSAWITKHSIDFQRRFSALVSSNHVHFDFKRKIFPKRNHLGFFRGTSRYIMFVQYCMNNFHVALLPFSYLGQGNTFLVHFNDFLLKIFSTPLCLSQSVAFALGSFRHISIITFSGTKIPSALFLICGRHIKTFLASFANYLVFVAEIFHFAFQRTKLRTTFSDSARRVIKEVPAIQARGHVLAILNHKIASKSKPPHELGAVVEAVPSKAREGVSRIIANIGLNKNRALLDITASTLVIIAQLFLVGKFKTYLPMGYP